MIGSGHERIERDAYFTIEPWITKVLVKELKSHNLQAIWEPACGAGHMVEELLNLAPVFGSDIHQYPIIPGLDFTFEQHDFMCPDIFDARLRELHHSGFPLEAIITNPPYEKTACEAFVRQAVGYLDRPGSDVEVVAMLLRHEWDCASKRNDLFRNNIHFTRKIVLTSRPRWIIGTAGSPRFSYAWYIWTRKNTSSPSIIWRGRTDAVD